MSRASPTAAPGFADLFHKHLEVETPKSTTNSPEKLIGARWRLELLRWISCKGIYRAYVTTPRKLERKAPWLGDNKGRSRWLRTFPGWHLLGVPLDSHDETFKQLRFGYVGFCQGSSLDPSWKMQRIFWVETCICKKQGFHQVVHILDILAGSPENILKTTIWNESSQFERGHVIVPRTHPKKFSKEFQLLRIKILWWKDGPKSSKPYSEKSPKKYTSRNTKSTQKFGKCPKQSRFSRKNNQIPKIFPRKPTNKNLTENSTYRGSGNRCFTVKFRRPCGLNVAKKKGKFSLDVWLVGGWTNPSEKYVRQIGSFPQIEVNTKNVWNHHLVELFEPLEVQPTKQRMLVLEGWFM